MYLENPADVEANWKVIEIGMGHKPGSDADEPFHSEWPTGNKAVRKASSPFTVAPSEGFLKGRGLGLPHRCSVNI